MADFKPIETQEDFDKMIQKRLEQKEREVSERFKDYRSPDEIKELTSGYEGKLKEANEALKAERDKSIEASKKVTEIEERAKVAETRYLKGKIAVEKGLPYELADRLIGETEEDLLKDAESISALLNPKSAPPLYSNDTRTSTGGTAATDAAYSQLLAGINQQIEQN
jgi:LPS O-antigen subunit length determinant protein (WzzB/FepE family)